MVGGGACGLLTAMLLADDGHEVVVLERDPQEPPAPADAWDEWERRGVNQFRLPHGLLARFRLEASAVLPRVVNRLIAEGAHEGNILGPSGPPRFLGLTAKRPFVEACIALEAASTPGVAIRRGVGVTGLLTGDERLAGVPHVTGVVTDDGDEVVGDLVIDAGGRRSAMPRWLAALGAKTPLEERESSGFTYYGTHYRSPDGTQHAVGPVTRYFGSVAVLALAGEHGTWGVGLITASDDAELRCLRDPARWRSVMRALPGTEALLDGEPLHEVRSMTNIEDRSRRYVVDGQPVATGVVSIADAVAATNPSRGRGISMGLIHGRLLRDTLAKMGLGDPVELALAFDDVTQAEIMLHYTDTLWDDRHRIAQVRAASRDEPYDWSDPDWAAWNRFSTWATSGTAPPAMLERLLDQVMMLRTTAAVLADAEVAAAMATAGDLPLPDPVGPSRGDLLALATA